MTAALADLACVVGEMLVAAALAGILIVAMGWPPPILLGEWLW